MCIVHFVQFEFLPTKQAETYLEIYVLIYHFWMKLNKNIYLSQLIWLEGKHDFREKKEVIFEHKSCVPIKLLVTFVGKKILVKGWAWHFLDKVPKVVFGLMFFTFPPQTYKIDLVLVLHRIISSSSHPSKTDHPVQALPRIAVRGWINNIVN